MKKNRLVILLFIASIPIIVFQSSISAEATKDSYVCHMHTDDYHDADYFKDLLDDKSYTTNTYYGSNCLTNRFDDSDRTVMYWSAHGNSSGNMWGYNGPFNALSTLNISGTDSDWENPSHTITTSDWDGDIEFAFISACNQLHSNVRYKYARSMLGTNRVRVISGYHDYAPGPPCDGYISQKFEEYADASQSVKYSWIQANEYWAGQGYTNPNHWCVLTHSGNVQYSRMPGFGGTQYDRPGTSTASILRFSQLYPNGTPQPLNSGRNDELVEKAGLLINCEPGVFAYIPDYYLIKYNADISIDITSDIFKTMNTVKCESNEGLYTMHELGDKPIGFSKESAIDLTRNWANEVYNERSYLFTANLKEVIPLVVAEVDLDGNDIAEKEELFAYSVRFANMYDGIRIRDNFFLALVDNEGIASSMLRWNNFSKSTAKQIIEQPLSYEKAIGILSDSIYDNPDPAMQVSNDSITINNVEIVFSDEITKNGEYHPTWQFDIADGTTILIDCFDNQVLSIR